MQRDLDAMTTTDGKWIRQGGGPYLLCRGLLGVVFIHAGGSKLLSPVTFAVLIDAYGIVPGPLLLPVAIFLPAVEVIAGIGLLFDVEGSLGVITVLMILFIAILGYGIQMGLDVDCGCFGPDDPEAEAFHGLRESLYRDLVLLAGVAFLYAWRRFRAITPLKITTLTNRFLKKRRAEDAAV
jgi:uncharacterized membrane protein YphA (DoxX/SURF4 family)